MNSNNSRDNITTTTIEVDYKLEKKLERSFIVITYYKELKELIARAKRFANITTTIQEFWKKIYKIYSNN